MTNRPPKTPPTKTGEKADQAAQKEERLARALRENLKRRKALTESVPERGDAS